MDGTLRGSHGVPVRHLEISRWSQGVSGVPKRSRGNLKGYQSPLRELLGVLGSIKRSQGRIRGSQSLWVFGGPRESQRWFMGSKRSTREFQGRFRGS